MANVLSNAPITISFVEGRVGGSAGCNRYFTTYQIDENHLSFDSKIGATMMACPEQVMTQESTFLNLLSQTSTYKVKDNQLTFFDDSGEALLIFENVTEVAGLAQHPPLVGTLWEWQRTTMEDGTIITVDDPSKYTALFGEDGSVVVKADCKQAQGTYIDEDSLLSIELGPTTMNVCSADSLADKFLSQLTNAGAYVFDSGNLIINMQMDSGNIVMAPAVIATAPEEDATTQPQVGLYKAVLPPTEAGGDMRVVTLALEEDGNLTLTIQALGAEEAEVYHGTWTMADDQLTVKVATPEGNEETSSLDISPKGDLKLVGTDLELIHIDANIPLHKQLAIPVITEQKAYVSLDIQAGNPLDPFIVSVNGGGELNASALGGECNGYINPSPVVRVNWQGEADISNIFFYSDHDPTLIIQSPDGAFHCNDDANRLLLDPSITFQKPQKGVYNIWVGSYYPDQLLPGMLIITTRKDVNVETFTLNGLIHRGPMTSLVEQARERPVETLLDAINRQKENVLKIEENKTESIEITAKGDIPAFEFDIPGQTCNGFIQEQPDAVFEWSGEADAISIYFEGDADSTLLIVEPGGQVICNDDVAPGRNLNPMVAIPHPASGRYAIFVGRLRPDSALHGTLSIAGSGDVQPALLEPKPASGKQ
jgi:heat shock protein HslJ